MMWWGGTAPPQNLGIPPLCCHCVAGLAGNDAPPPPPPLQGWLDITYLDDTHRVGRDDKGNLFYLERVDVEKTSS